MNVRKTSTFSGHFAAIYCLIAKDKSKGTFLSAGGDGHIVEWNIDAPDKGKVIATVDGKIFALTISNSSPFGNSKSLIAGDMVGGLHWIDLEAKKEAIGRALHKKGIFNVYNQGEFLYSLGGDGFLGKWNTKTGRASESTQISGHSLRSFSFSPKNDMAAVGASDGNIHILHLRTLEIIHTIKNAHKNSVFSVQWSPDGEYLLSGGRDALLKLWQSSDFSEISSEPAHWYTINDIAFSPNGKLFATASRDKSLKIWQTEGFKLKKVIAAPRFAAHANSVNRVLWMSDSLLLSTGDDRSILAWKIEE